MFSRPCLDGAEPSFIGDFDELTTGESTPLRVNLREAESLIRWEVPGDHRSRGGGRPQYRDPCLCGPRGEGGADRQRTPPRACRARGTSPTVPTRTRHPPKNSPHDGSDRTPGMQASARQPPRERPVRSQRQRAVHGLRREKRWIRKPQMESVWGTVITTGLLSLASTGGLPPATPISGATQLPLNPAEHQRRITQQSLTDSTRGTPPNLRTLCGGARRGALMNHRWLDRRP